MYGIMTKISSVSSQNQLPMLKNAPEFTKMMIGEICTKDKVDILENKNQQVSKLSMNTDVSGVLPFFSERLFFTLKKGNTPETSVFIDNFDTC